MVVHSMDELLKLFKVCPFTIKVIWTHCESHIAIIDLQFHTLTCMPILDVLEGDKEIMKLQYCIDTHKFLSDCNDVYVLDNGTILDGILSPTMITLFSYALSMGEFQNPSYYSYIEYILEYYFHYVTVYPFKKWIEYEGEQYHEQVGFDACDSIRKQMISCFNLQKSKELFEKFGIEAVHWINSISAEYGANISKELKPELIEQKRRIEVAREKARLLRDSLLKQEENVKEISS